jgi:hypothetical protein
VGLISRRIRNHTRRNAYGLIAVFIALGGTSYAVSKLPKNSVGPKQIKANAVGTSEAADDALTGSDINEGTLGQVSRADSADSAAGAQNANLLDDLDSSDFLRAGAQAGGDLSGTLSDLQIGSDAVGQPELAPPEPWNEVGDGDGPAFGTGTNWNCGPPAVTNFDSNHNSAAFYRDPFGTVHLKGLVKSGVNDACGSFFELPPGYRPAKRSVFNARESSGTIRVNVDGPAFGRGLAIAGVVGLDTMLPANTFVSLDGITFRCAPSGQNGCP